jgi:hypothetical protein
MPDSARLIHASSPAPLTLRPPDCRLLIIRDMPRRPGYAAASRILLRGPATVTGSEGPEGIDGVMRPRPLGRPPESV